MTGIGTAEIKVTPEVLVQKAAEVNASISSVEKRFEELKNIIEHTRYYWIGVAGDRHRQIYRDREEEIQGILHRLREYPADLQQIAGVYKGSEADIKEKNSGIPSNLIS